MPSRFDDPGWPWREGLVAMIPIVGVLTARRTTGKSVLWVLRLLFMRLASAPVLLGVVLLFINGEPDATITPAAAVALIAIGMSSLAISETYARRIGRVKHASEALGAYRAIFFLRFALSEVTSLAAFVFFFFDGTGPTTYLLGLAITEIGFWRMAPTRAAIERDQRLLPHQVNLGQLLTAVD